MARYERSKVFPGFKKVFKRKRVFLEEKEKMAAEQIFHPSHLLQALLKPLQKKPAMGPRVLAKRLMAAQ